MKVGAYKDLEILDEPVNFDSEAVFLFNGEKVFISRCDAIKIIEKLNTIFDLDNLDKIINRRVDVENYLFNVSIGKKTLSKEDCKILALRLGTPKENWTDKVKNHVFGDRNE